MPPEPDRRASQPYGLVMVHLDAPPKPAVGQACNGCGLCCLVEPCPLGVLVSRRRTGACDALRWNAELSLYRCGLVDDPCEVLGWRWRWLGRWMAPLARRWIASGAGCDAHLHAEVDAGQ